MKIVKSKNWIRLRGQVISANEVCKIDTLISDKERVFFVPETDEEKDFLYLDTMFLITLLPYGPVSHNPDDEWGWRFYPEKNEEDVKIFVDGIKKIMASVYNTGVENIYGKKAKERVLN